MFCSLNQRNAFHALPLYRHKTTSIVISRVLTISSLNAELFLIKPHLTVIQFASAKILFLYMRIYICAKFRIILSFQYVDTNIIQGKKQITHPFHQTLA
jgi:hypothetical protein